MKGLRSDSVSLFAYKEHKIRYFHSINRGRMPLQNEKGEVDIMENYFGACGCVGYAYVPVQEMDGTYGVCEALNQGTVFPELDLNICEYGKLCKGAGVLSDE